MKRKNAKELLAESFRELAQTKNINKITIQEIVSNCGYSPATFYRQFQDKYDMIAWDYAQGIARIMSRIAKEEDGWRKALLDAALHYQAEKEYLSNLLLHTSGLDSFVRYMCEINYDALEKHIMAVSGQKNLDEMTRMYIRTYCLGTVNLSCEWILGRYQAGPEKLAQVFAHSMPEPLRQYLE